LNGSRGVIKASADRWLHAGLHRILNESILHRCHGDAGIEKLLEARNVVLGAGSPTSAVYKHDEWRRP
jgi:hypothetical protein